jgi:4-hydroxybenzoate polyprenyltransferase
MKRFTVFFRETWWLWIVCSSVSIGMSIFLTPIMLCGLPMLLVVFLYFALVRYDSDGNFIGS